MKPFNPKEAVQENKRLAVDNIPEFVIEAANKMLALNVRSGAGYVSASFNQDELIKEIMKGKPTYNFGESARLVTRNDLFNNKWLDIEEAYRQQGWSVNYDKPGYNEDYVGFWEFKMKPVDNFSTQ